MKRPLVPLSMLLAPGGAAVGGPPGRAPAAANESVIKGRVVSYCLVSSAALLSIWALLMFALPGAAAAHEGLVDRYSCHPDRKAGNYHCHWRSPLAGRTFSSEAEMLRAIPPDIKRRKPPREKISTLCASSSAITTADIEADRRYGEKSELDGKPVELCCRMGRMSFDKDPFVTYHCLDEWWRIEVRYAGSTNFGDWDLVNVRGTYSSKREEVLASSLVLKRRDGRAFMERHHAANKVRYLGDSRGGRYPSRDGKLYLSLPSGFRPIERLDWAVFEWEGAAKSSSAHLVPYENMKSAEKHLQESSENSDYGFASPIEERRLANGLVVRYSWSAWRDDPEWKSEDDPERSVTACFSLGPEAYCLEGKVSKKPHGLDRVLQILGTIRPGK